MNRKVTLTLGVGVVLLTVMGAASVASLRRLVHSADWVAHTHDTRAAIAAVRAGLAQSEAAALHAALAASDPVTDSALSSAFARSRDAASRAAVLSADEPVQRQRLDALRGLLATRERHVRGAVAAVIAQRGVVAPARAVDSALTARGERAQTARILATLDSADASERDLLVARAESQAESASEATVVVLALLIAGGALGLYARRSIQSDIVARARMEQAARAAEQRFHAVFDQTFQFTALLTPAGACVELNDTALAFLGGAPEAALGRPFWELPLWSAGDREHVRDAVASAAAGAFVRFESAVHGREGATAVLDMSCKPMRGPTGATVMVIAEGRDVSERKEIEAALRASEAKFSGILAIAADAIVTVDESQRIVHFNTGAEQIFGYAAHEMMGQPLDILLPERTRAAHRGYVADFGRTAETARRMGHRREVAGRRRNGEEFPAEASISKLHTADGVLYTAVVRDVTERKRAEDRQRFLSEAGAALAASLDVEQTLAAVVRLGVPALGDLCMIEVWTGDDGDDGNDGAHVQCAIAHADPAQAEQLREMRRRYPPTRIETHPVTAVRRSGRPTLMRGVTEEQIRAAVVDETHAEMLRRVAAKSVMYIPVAARGHVLGVLTCGAMHRTLDDTDLELAGELARRAALAIDNARLYEQALRATRGRDEVLGVVSHDLRNPLSTINMCAGALLDPEPPSTEGVRSMAEIIQRSADWMQRIIRDLLDVTSIEAGRLALDRHPVGVSAVLDTVRELMIVQARDAGIELVVREPAALMPAIEADHERVVQVLLNLIGNAVKFTPAGGRVGVRADVVGADGPRSEPLVRFSVSDTGPGISAEHLTHIFDRYWQVRTQGRAGAGLGLAIAKGIVEAHDGTIGVTSTVGEGTTFSFTIPVARHGAAGPGGANPTTSDANARRPMTAHHGGKR